MEIETSQQLAITELVFENQKLKQERNEAQEEVKLLKAILDLIKKDVS